MKYDEPSYWRVVHTIDFNVPRRERPYTIGEREKETIPAAEEDRWKQAKEFSPFWFSRHSTCFLDDLDRLVLISPDGMEERNSPVAGIHPTIEDSTTVSFDDGDYHLITRWQVNPTIAISDISDRPLDLGVHYHQNYPTATWALALRNLQIESCLL